MHICDPVVVNLECGLRPTPYMRAGVPQPGAGTERVSIKAKFELSNHRLSDDAARMQIALQLHHLAGARPDGGSRRGGARK